MDPRDLKDSVDGDDTALRRALSEAQPKWAKDGLGVRGSQREIISQTVRQEWPDPVINYKEAARPPVTQPTDLKRPLQNVDAGAAVFPFKTTMSVESGTIQAKVYPGFVENMMASMDVDTWPLDSDPAPFTTPSGGISTLWMQANIDVDEANLYSYKIVSAVISATSDSAPPDPDQPDEYTIKWDDEDERTTGFFRVKIAKIKADYDAEKPTGSVLAQYAFDSFRTIAFIGEKAVSLA